jgi:hypothetical protein
MIERLSRSSSGEELRSSGSFCSFERQRLLLMASQPFTIASAVTVEHEDVLFVGEIVACAPEEDGVWKVLIQVHQLLNGLQSLTILRERLLWREEEPRLLPLTKDCALV